MSLFFYVSIGTMTVCANIRLHKITDCLVIMQHESFSFVKEFIYFLCASMDPLYKT